jgi:hypothetical protein
MPDMQISPEAAARLRLLARAWGISPMRALDRVLGEWEDAPGQEESPPPLSGNDSLHVAPASADTEGTPVDEHGREVDVYMDYHGQRVRGSFDRRSHALVVHDVPHPNRRFRSPSQAASEVVRALNPTVNPSRNGWITWFVTETNASLQSIRDDGGDGDAE